MIAGLQPGPHILRAEPLDDGDINSFFDDDFERRPRFPGEVPRARRRRAARRRHPRHRNQGEPEVRRRGRAIAAAVALSDARRPSPAAQARPGKGSVEVSGGITYVGGYSFDERTAELTANSGSTGAPFDLFTTDSEIKPVVGVSRAGSATSSPGRSRSRAGCGSPSRSTRSASPMTSRTRRTRRRKRPEPVPVRRLARLSLRQRQPRACRSSTAAPATCASCTKARPWSKKVSSTTPAAASRCGSAAARRSAIRGDVGVSFRDGGFDFEDKSRVVPEAGASLVWVF